jgi:hypothetical protein
MCKYIEGYQMYTYIVCNIVSCKEEISILKIGVVKFSASWFLDKAWWWLEASAGTSRLQNNFNVCCVW